LQKTAEFLRTKHVLLIDQSKRIRRIYNGPLQLEIEQVITDIAELSKEGGDRSKYMHLRIPIPFSFLRGNEF
jgi:hypothetical protein